MIHEMINSPENLVNRLNLFGNEFVFRGHSNIGWELKTSLRRLLYNNYQAKVEVFETYSLNEFKSKFYLYNKDDYEPKTDLEWLAMMQHYGTPTRLLDFTESPYIALYFCLENSNKKQKENMAIYALNYREINKTTINYLENLDASFKYDYLDIENNKDQIFENKITKFNIPLLWISEPKRLNKRIERQRGTFLYTNERNKTYEEILESEIYKNIPSFLLEFSANFWDNYYTILNKMNINGKTVYGDLEGLSKQIKMVIQAYSTERTT
ncbi:FRG domain-containing protein [uncultured Treponema sp.]|uniref:FRG domain-containing protein n=1 Tax=uncultured Treponema sp. TaxID=162155 RepID=UPI0028E393F1|nr:FRG domain-containing protein [uncultured Treponema sp.]